jgi:hypothetical protein
MIVEANAADIIYSSLFTGVHGNYLKPSVVAAGLDPDNLPESDPSKMDFGSGSSKAKAWRDVWGSGQGIGAVKGIVGAADLVARLQAEYRAARRRALRALRHGFSFSRPCPGPRHEGRLVRDPLKNKRGASAGCAGTGPRRRIRRAGLGPAGGRDPSAVCEAADGRARAQGQVPSATLTRTPRARRRLDPWPRASALAWGALSASPRGPTL